MNDTIKLISSFTAGLLVGGAGTYLLTKKQLESYYANAAQQDIDTMKEHYSVTRKEGAYSTPEKAVMARHGEDYVKTLKDLGYSELPNRVVEGNSPESEEAGVPEEEDSVVAINVFDGVDGLDDEPDDEEEVDIRDPNRPYVLDIEEFMEQDVVIDGRVYNKITLTYFDGDNTLIDDREEVIPDLDRTVGIGNMTRFGHKSKDKNVVYVRNERLETDFEVLLDRTAYTETVLGFHDAKASPKRFRDNE